MWLTPPESGSPGSRRAAVLGRPIDHSLSPLLHEAAYRALGLRWRYDAIDCAEPDLPGVLDRAGPEWAGFSCTMPIKRRAFELAVSSTDRAARVGAANTLLPAGSGAWHADNTDVAGILGALDESGVAPSAVVVLGAGGTAAAAVVALGELGLRRCRVLVREPARADPLRMTAARAGVHIEVGRLDDPGAVGAADLLVSTLPAGAADPLAARPWPPSVALLDVVYHPWPTALAAAIERAGGVVIGGHAMLLHQAVEQVRLMTDRRAPVGAMRTALAEATRLR
jgi:shikimate dehydrogenase